MHIECVCACFAAPSFPAVSVGNVVVARAPLLSFFSHYFTPFFFFLFYSTYSNIARRNYSRAVVQRSVLYLSMNFICKDFVNV